MTLTSTTLTFISPPTIAKLESLGFTYLDSSDGVKYYTYRFPVEFYKNAENRYIPTLFAILTANSDTGEVLVDVKTLRGIYYADFYQVRLDKKNEQMYPMLIRIYKRINDKLKEFNIVGEKVHRTSHRKDKTNDKRRSQEDRKQDYRSASRSKQVLQGRKSNRSGKERTRNTRQSV